MARRDDGADVGRRRSVPSGPGAGRPGAEEGGPEPDHRRALDDRRLEVVAHAVSSAPGDPAGRRGPAPAGTPARLSAADPSGATAISPRTSRPAPPRSPARAGTSSGRQPPRAGSSVRLTWTSTGTPGARAAISRPSAGRSTLSIEVDVRRHRLHLVALELADEVPARTSPAPHRRARTATAAWPPAPGRSSPRCRRARRPTRPGWPRHRTPWSPRPPHPLRVATGGLDAPAHLGQRDRNRLRGRPPARSFTSDSPPATPPPPGGRCPAGPGARTTPGRTRCTRRRRRRHHPGPPQRHARRDAEIECGRRRRR